MEVNQTNYIYIVSRIRERLIALLEGGLAEKHITDFFTSDGYVLFILDRHGPLSLKELALHAVKDKSTVSSVVKRLEKNGYVVKERAGDDARTVTIRLTAKAKKIKPLIWEISSEVNSKMFRGLGEDDRKKLFQLTGKVFGNIHE
ncbi:MAG TPA: MarR family transcriptional regulator [Spirochaetota bacterium]|nr:MarR family transcriptional regulator [Spirochaetota bacterium]